MLPQISSDSSENEVIADVSDDDEDIISSRRKRGGNGKKASKKSHRLFESGILETFVCYYCILGTSRSGL